MKADTKAQKKADKQKNENARQNLLHVIAIEDWTREFFAHEYTSYKRARISDFLAGKKDADLPSAFRKVTARALMISDEQLCAEPEAFKSSYRPIGTRKVVTQEGVIASFEASRQVPRPWTALTDKLSGGYIVYFRRPHESSAISAAYLAIHGEIEHGIAADLHIPYQQDSKLTHHYSGVALPVGNRWLYFFLEQAADEQNVGRAEVICLIVPNVTSREHPFVGHVVGIDASNDQPGGAVAVVHFDKTLKNDDWRDSVGTKFRVMRGVRQIKHTGVRELLLREDAVLQTTQRSSRGK